MMKSLDVTIFGVFALAVARTAYSATHHPPRSVSNSTTKVPKSVTAKG